MSQINQSTSSSSSSNLKIGIDFGGVLSTHDGKDVDKEHRNITINMPQALESLIEMKKRGYKLYLISFAGKSRSIETYNSIKDMNLFDDYFFVKDKKYKRNIAEYLGLDLMIDDNIGIIYDVSKYTNTILFLGDPNADDPNQIPKNTKICTNWNDIIKYIDENLSNFIGHKSIEKDINKLLYNVTA